MANKTTVRGAGGIDMRQYRDFMRDLKKVNPKLRKELQKQLRAAGEEVAVDARALAVVHSRKIPPTVKVRTSGVSVAVVAGGKADTAIAGLFELGNAGNRKSAAASRSGRFRHPVFGDRSTWVDQPMHPYLAPAAKRMRKRVRQMALDAIDAAMDELKHGR